MKETQDILESLCARFVDAARDGRPEACKELADLINATTGAAIEYAQSVLSLTVARNALAVSLNNIGNKVKGADNA